MPSRPLRLIPLTLAALALLLALGLALKSPKTPVPEPLPAPLPVASTDLPAETLPSSGPAPSYTARGLSPALESGLPDLSDKNTVLEFEVRRGWAVFQSDILLGKPEEGSPITRGRTEMARPQTWESPKVPYLVQPTVLQPERIHRALEILKTQSPVEFIPYTGQRDAIVFELGDDHCQSYLGKTGGLQPIFLAPDCQPQQILHEVLHALGFIHEHARPERDRYLEVLWPNIQPQYKEQFARMSEAFMEVSGRAPFDPQSVMMYEPNAFALNEAEPTLRLRDGGKVQSSHQGLGPSDIARLKSLYPD